MVQYDRYIETPDPSAARRISARNTKIFGKGSFKVKNLGKVQGNKIPGVRFPMYKIRIRKVK